MRHVLLIALITACNKASDVDTTPPTTTPTGTQTTQTTQTTGDGDPWFCAADVPVVTPLGGGIQQVETTHYSLTLAVTPKRAEELGYFAESAYLAMADRFGAEPTEAKLEVELYPDRSSFDAGIQADGLTPPNGAGGYYHPDSKKAYAIVQPTQYYEDVILLHEMIHQFQYLARTGNQNIPGWYTEGMAEAWSRHDWDLECLRIGRIPLVSQEDTYAAALSEIDAGGVPLEAILDESTSASRPMAMAIVQFLDQTYPAEFATFRDAMDNHTNDPVGDFISAIGQPAAIAGEIEGWIQNHQEPMSVVYLEWIHRGPQSVESLFVNGVSSLTRAKSTTDLSATLVPLSDPWIGGFLVAWDGNSDNTAAFVDESGDVSFFEVSGGSVDWYSVGSVTAPGTDPVEISLTHSGGDAVLTVNGTEISAPILQSPAAGLAVYDADVRFDDLTGL